MAAQTPTKQLQRINQLCNEQIESLKSQMKTLGATVEDEHGGLIPQPENDRERIMFAAGQTTMALFFKGATLDYESK